MTVSLVAYTVFSTYITNIELVHKFLSKEIPFDFFRQT